MRIKNLSIDPAFQYVYQVIDIDIPNDKLILTNPLGIDFINVQKAYIEQLIENGTVGFTEDKVTIAPAPVKVVPKKKARIIN